MSCTRNDTSTHTAVQLQFNTPFCSGRAWMCVCLLNTVLCQSRVYSDITSWWWNRDMRVKRLALYQNAPLERCAERPSICFLLRFYYYILKYQIQVQELKICFLWEVGQFSLLPFYVCVFMQSTAKDRPSLRFLEFKKWPKSLKHTDNNQMLSIVLYLLCKILLNIIHTLNTVKNCLGREKKIIHRDIKCYFSGLEPEWNKLCPVHAA